MKKGATKTSGILTLILYFLLLVVSVFAVATVLEITAITDILSSSEMLAKIVGAIMFPFVDFPQILIAKFMSGMDVETLKLINQIVSFTFAAFSAYMIFWGIKEITLTKKDDANFAKCKKTCGFMMFLKFMVFVYFLAVVACCFLIEEVSLYMAFLELAFGIPYVPVIVSGVLAVYSFVIFILPVINFSKAAKGFVADPNAQYNADPNAQYGANGQYIDPNNGYYDPNGQQYAAQPTMQANMPPMPGYQPQYSNVQAAPGQPQPIYSNEPPPQPSIQSQFNPQVQAQEQQLANSIQPGQNGIPLNITPKGIADLERLERLKNSGAITEENYIAMRTKICNTNLS